MKTYAYDIETYPNFFSCIFEDISSNEKHIFYAHESYNNLNAFLSFVTRKMYCIGYNSSRFDSMLVRFMIMFFRKYNTLDSFLKAINVFADKLISLQDDNGFYNDELVKTVSYYNNYYVDIDMYTMLALNKAFKSLKQTAVNLKWHKIQEIPIKPGSTILIQDVDTVLDYNANDVGITKKLFLEHIEDAKLRMNISKLYNVPVLSSSKSNIADRLLNKFYEERSGKSYYEFRNLRTEYGSIRISECISTKVEFQTDEFKSFLNLIKDKVIRNTKKDLEMKVIHNLVKYSIGTGGLHSEDPPGIFEETDENYIIDADVTSYYPNIILNERICPAHLDIDAFLDVVRMIVEDRTESKIIAKKLEKLGLIKDSEYIEHSTRADSLKIVVNAGGFGKMGYEYYWLYDRKAMVQVTINGQLFLFMLIEELVRKGFKVISANTDGIITIVPKSRFEEYNRICKDWESNLGLSLEYTYYTKYVRRDVNNYIAIPKDGKIKQKGIFSTKIEIEKGYPTLAINKALNEYFVNNTSVHDAIVNNKDIYDFCLSQKVDKKFDVVTHKTINGELVVEKLQKVVRFFVSNSGVTIYKQVDPLLYGEDRRTSLCAGWNVTVFNDYYEPDDNNFYNYNIDYRYYVSKTQEIVDKIVHGIKGKGRKSTRIKAGSANKSNLYTGTLFDDELINNQ